MRAWTACAPSVSVLSDAELGDERLNRRLGLLADRLADRPGESFPKALDDAELEAAYRFFGNERVSPDGILAPHVRQSARRAADHAHVLVVHDTVRVPGAGEAAGARSIDTSGTGVLRSFLTRPVRRRYARAAGSVGDGDGVPARPSDPPEAANGARQSWRIGPVATVY